MFVKGKSGNPKGRPLGKPNFSTGEIRGALQRMMEDQLPKMIRDLDRLPVDERAEILSKFANFVLPKLAHTDATVRTLPTPIVYEKSDGTKVTLDAKND